MLRQLQAIRIGTLKIGQDSKRLLTQIPPELNAARPTRSASAILPTACLG